MIDKNRIVILNGQEVAAGWGAILRAAQEHRVYRIRRKVFERIPFGQDYAGKESDAESCRDCAAARGQLHVPVCCLEQCPRCGGQVLGCDCGVLERKSNRTFPVPDDQDGEVQE
jgi:hypothetical protein